MVKRFRYWSRLNTDCQKQVLKFLDFRTRISLSKCSRADYSVSEATPYDLYAVDIVDGEARTTQTDLTAECVTVHLKFRKGHLRPRVFTKFGRHTAIKWESASNDGYEKRKHEYILLDIHYIKAAAMFAEMWLKRSHYTISEIKIRLNKYPCSMSSIESLPLCKNVSVGSSNLNLVKWWFDKFPRNMEKVSIFSMNECNNREKFLIPDDFLSRHNILNASECFLWCPTEITDEQLHSLKMLRIVLESDLVTDAGINQFLKRWIEGRGNQVFYSIMICKRKTRDLPNLVKGTNAEEIVDQQAENPNPCYIIPSRVDIRRSLLVTFGNERLMICQLVDNRAITRDTAFTFPQGVRIAGR